MAAPDYTPSFPKIPLAFMGASTDELDLVWKTPGQEIGLNPGYRNILRELTYELLKLTP